MSSSSGDDFSAFYAALSARFRGPYDEIKRRLRVHAHWLAASGGPPGPVVDLGVGRGEWIELAREAGWTVVGIDDNPDIVSETRARGFEVVESDALLYLDSVEAGSVGAVTAFHLIEHLSAADRLHLLRSAHRALAAGGFVLLEWPNIAHPRVAQYTYWLDPTHNAPLPRELAEFMTEHAGFTDIRVTRLDAGQPVGFEALDLALWARKPGAAGGRA